MSVSLKELASDIRDVRLERALRQILENQVVLQGSAAFAPNLVDAAGSTHSLTVTGAAIGDFVLVSCAIDAVDVTMTGYVQAANTVEIRVQNESGATFNPGSTTFYVRVFPRNSYITA